MRQRLFQPVDIASLVAFRILFGAIMLWEVCRYFQNDWISRYYIRPRFHFTYYGFDWVSPWPGQWMYVHFALLGVLAACIIAGLHYRLCTALFFVGFTYVFLLDQAQYLNHFYFVSLMTFLMIFVPAHRALSLDARLRPELRSDTAPAWSLWILRAQVGLVYFYAGVAKINHDWLRGEPMRAWLAQRDDYSLLGPLLPVGQLFREEWVVYLFSYGGLLLDLLVVPFLLWRPSRAYAFGLLVYFHLTNAWLFNIGIFPWFAMAATLLFFEPDWPRRIFNWPRRDAELTRNGEAAPPSSPIRTLGFAFWSFYFALQVLVPLRHLLYPSDVHWTEEGHRFSWHMKLRDKQATAEFELRNPATGTTWTVKPTKYLSHRQAGKMAARPDMVLQFAHFLRDKLRQEGHENIEVRAIVKASLNGRPMAPLIDPAVNLAAEPRNLWAAKWILPLNDTPPSSSRPNGESDDESDEPMG